MRRGSLFWGALILLAGVLLLLNNFFPNLFSRISVWDIIWPVAIILIGASLLFGPRWGGRRSLESQDVMVPLESASDAEVRLYHGAGRLSVRSTSTPGVLLSGTCVGGADVNVSKSGPSTRLDLRSRAGDAWFGNPGPFGFAWDLVVTPEVPLRLTVETGASETNLDLRDLKVTDLQINTGASSSVVTLPGRAGMTRVKVAAGAASVKLYVPEGVAANIAVQSGLAGIHIDQNRFPAAAGGYQSTDYDTAANRADIFVETGVGSVDIQ
jgi:hypothetical protein